MNPMLHLHLETDECKKDKAGKADKTDKKDKKDKKKGFERNELPRTGLARRS